MPKGSSVGSDLFTKMKVLQKQLEFLDIQEEYIKDEMQHLKRELVRAKDEVKRIQSVPLVIGQVPLVMFVVAIAISPELLRCYSFSKSSTITTESPRALRAPTTMFASSPRSTGKC